MRSNTAGQADAGGGAQPPRSIETKPTAFARFAFDEGPNISVVVTRPGPSSQIVRQPHRNSILRLAAAACWNAPPTRLFAAISEPGVSRLIIDVRGNTGGQSDAGARIIQSVQNPPAAQVSRARERLHDENNGLLDYRGAAGSMRELVVDYKLIQPAPDDTRFKGRVAVLIDELTYSAGILFATTMQDHKLATVVGRPTGGFANQTDNMMPTRLPATGFTAFIAQPGWIERQLDAPAS